MKQLPKLSLKKETITKLNDDQMRKFVGGLAEISSSSQSCNKLSCDSKSNAGSCGKKSCNCPNEIAIDEIA
ncbi:MAG: class I lanthipeptide [Saprospiraceae bacterium]|nr:class I lanthipeptide [Saprospiraceae bacterium]